MDRAGRYNNIHAFSGDQKHNIQRAAYRSNSHDTGLGGQPDRSKKIKEKKRHEILFAWTVYTYLGFVTVNRFI